MSAEGSIGINLEGNIFKMLDELNQKLGNIEQRVEDVEGAAKKGFDGINNALQNINLVNIVQGFDQLSNSLNSLNAPGLNYQKSMADMSAITGLTGDKLDKLGAMARQNAKDFGGDAAASVETYKLLLSQLGPDLAKTPELLNKMARGSETLGKTMGGDTVLATQVLTTAMNQYNVSMDDPIKATKELDRMMNAMAASAKEGSSELPTLQAAVNVVGGDSKRAGLQFEEMLASIQLLDKAGKKGAEGGVALRNVLSSLAQGRFLPKDVKDGLKAYGVDINKLNDPTIKFTDRLRELKKMQHDTALVAKLFGKENQGAAQALIGSVDAQDQMRESITGTNTAYDQAAVIMDTVAEKQARMEAAINDAKIAFFEATGGASAFLAPVAELGQVFTGFAPVLNLVWKGLKLLRIHKLAAAAATKIVTAAQWLWNVALNANPIGAIIIAVTALTAAVYAVAKAFDTSTASERANQKIKDKVIEKTADERAELDLLFAQLKKTNAGSEERNELVDKLNEKYPNILANYDLEKASLNEINAAQQEIIKTIETRARAEAARELLTENYKQQLKSKKDINKDGWLSYLSSATGNPVAGKVIQQQWNASEYHDLKKEGDALLKEVMKSEKKAKEAAGKSNSESSPLEFSPDSDKKIKNIIDVKDKKVSGRTQSKNITVHIQNLVGTMNIQKANPAQTKAAMRNEVADALIGVVNDFEVAIQ